MTKSELVDRIATKHALPRRTAEEIVNVVFNTMRDVLVDGGRVEVRGFGSFKVKDYPGYTGRNPRTNEEIEVIIRIPVDCCGNTSQTDIDIHKRVFIPSWYLEATVDVPEISDRAI